MCDGGVMRFAIALAVTTLIGGATLALASLHRRPLRASVALAAEPLVVGLPGPRKTESVEQPVARPEIPELLAPWLDDIAMASVTSGGGVIYVNPKRCAELGPLVCGFFRQHEHGHIKLRHGGARYTTEVGGRELAEEEADCYAAKHARFLEVRATIEFFLRPEYVDTALGAHSTGQKRAERIKACREG